MVESLVGIGKGSQLSRWCATTRATRGWRHKTTNQRRVGLSGLSLAWLMALFAGSGHPCGRGSFHHAKQRTKASAGHFYPTHIHSISRKGKERLIMQEPLWHDLIRDAAYVGFLPHNYRDLDHMNNILCSNCAYRRKEIIAFRKEFFSRKRKICEVVELRLLAILIRWYHLARLGLIVFGSPLYRCVSICRPGGERGKVKPCPQRLGYGT